MTPYRFGVFEFDASAGELRKQGLKIHLHGQPLEILALLLEHPGQVVTREEMQKKLWPADTFVEFDAGLNAAIKRLRAALSDDPATPHYVETIPRRGYRFIGRPVNCTDTPDAAVASPPVLRRYVRLRWGVPLTLIVLLALIGLLFLDVGRLRSRIFVNSDASTTVDSVAVLPLTNLTGDPRQDYFVEGMHEALINELSEIKSLKVCSRTSTLRYRTTDKTLPQIAEELNVGGIVEGSVFREGEQVRITVQLIHAASDRHMWGQSFDRDLHGVLSLYKDVAQAIVAEIKVRTTSEEETLLATRRRVNPAAYEALLRGRHLLNTISSESAQRALKEFEDAVKRDPNDAPAHAGLAKALYYVAFFGDAPAAEVLPQGKREALAAIRLDNNIYEAHEILGSFTAYYERDWRGAEQHFRKAIEVEPGSPQAHSAYARFLARTGRHAEARKHIDRAVSLDPDSIFLNHVSAWIAYMAHDYARSAPLYQTVLRMDPNYVRSLEEVAVVYALKGEPARAVEAAERCVYLSSSSHSLASLGMVYGFTGHEREAREVLAQLIKLRKQKYVGPMQFALVHTGLGNKDKAIDWLQKAFRERSNILPNIYQAPHYDSLRGEPRFQALLRAMNFPTQAQPSATYVPF